MPEYINYSEIIKEIEQEISEEDFERDVVALTRYQQMDGFGELCQRVLENAKFLPRKIAEQNKALILDQHETGNYKYTIGLVDADNPRAQRAKNAVSRALNIYSVGTIDYRDLSAVDFARLFDQAYGSQKLAAKKTNFSSDKRSFNPSTKKQYNWSSFSTIENAPPPESILKVTSVVKTEDLSGKRLDLTEWDWYYSILQQIEDGSYNFSALTTLQKVAFVLMDFLKFEGNDFHLQCNGLTGYIRYRRQNEMVVRWEGIDYDTFNKMTNSLCGLVGRDAARLGRESVESVLKLRLLDEDGEINDVQFRYEAINTIPYPTTNLRSQQIPITDIDKIGFLDFQILDLRRALAADKGIVFVTGATGSGKSFTLNSMCRILEDELVWNIYEFGSPIESESARRNQVNLRDYADPVIRRKYMLENFKAVLRLDPDIIVLTETREKWEADVAMEMAVTGHQVFTTLHAGNVLETFTRLLSMNLDLDNLINSMSAIVSQRLINRLCPICRTEDAENSVLAGRPVYRESGFLPNGKPCIHCNAGFAGRTVIAEILLINDLIAQWIRAGKSPEEIVRLAVEARFMIPMKRIALEKFLDGTTSESQIRAVCDIGDALGATDGYFDEAESSSSANTAPVSIFDSFEMPVDENEADENIIEADFYDVSGNTDSGGGIDSADVDSRK